MFSYINQVIPLLKQPYANHPDYFYALILCSINANGQTPVIDSLQKIIALGKKDSLEASALIALSGQYTRTDINKAKQQLYAAMPVSNGQK